MVDKGLFSSGHVIFRIEVPSKGWSVERRFKEFGDLRIELERLHPATIVPPIYGPANEKDTKPETIANTRQVLQQFLDDLLKHPLLGCSELVYYFLQCPVQAGKKVDEFQKRQKLYSLMPVPKEVEEMKSEEGSAPVALTEGVNVHVETMNDSIAKLKQLYQE